MHRLLKTHRRHSWILQEDRIDEEEEPGEPDRWAYHDGIWARRLGPIAADGRWVAQDPAERGYLRQVGAGLAVWDGK